MKIPDGIYDVVAIHTGLDPDKLDASADIMYDLGASELCMVQIILDIEKKFGIEIPDEKIEDLKTIEKLEYYVRQKMPADVTMK